MVAVVAVDLRHVARVDGEGGLGGRPLNVGQLAGAGAARRRRSKRAGSGRTCSGEGGGAAR